MSKNAEKAKKYFEAGLWNRTMLENLVKRGWLSRDELEIILNVRGLSQNA